MNAPFRFLTLALLTSSAIGQVTLVDQGAFGTNPTVETFEGIVGVHPNVPVNGGPFSGGVVGDLPTGHDFGNGMTLTTIGVPGDAAVLYDYSLVPGAPVGWGLSIPGGDVNDSTSLPSDETFFASDTFTNDPMAPIVITFDNPVIRFGGFFESANSSAIPGTTATGLMFLEAFDAGGASLGMVQLQTDGVQVDASLDTFVGIEATAGAVIKSVALFCDGQSFVCDNLQIESTSPLGVSVCMTAPNSNGPGAILSASGSASVAANDLVLTAFGASATQPGIMYYGTTTLTGTPFGDGFRCAGGTLVRLLPPTVSDASGTLTKNVDNSIGLVTGSTAPIADMATLTFQAWFRDPMAGNTGFNLSDGLEITFVP